jgi:hypothetical protein
MVELEVMRLALLPMDHQVMLIQVEAEAGQEGEPLVTVPEEVEGLV